MNSIIIGLHRMLPPCLTIIRTQDNNFSFHSTERSEMRDFNYNRSIRNKTQTFIYIYLSINIELLNYKNYPRNLAPTGPSSRIRLAKASPSIRGGGWVSLSRFKYLHVILIGIAAFRGGTITRTPECRQPRIAPPRASTKKLTRKLEEQWLAIKKIIKTLNN